jgi:hypothetical protein
MGKKLAWAAGAVIICVDHQKADKSFAVYIMGDDDTEGAHDRMYSYGRDDNGVVVTEDEARGAAIDYANRLSARMGGRGIIETATQ